MPSEGKFGVDPEAAVGLLLAARDLGLDPYGITFHVGSQMLSPLAWERPLRMVGQVMEKLRSSGIRLRMVDVGGGFPARYSAQPLPLTEFADVIAAGLAALPYDVDVVIEPGRAVVAEAGTLIATVIGTALRHGDRWAHLDVGAFNGLMESLETNNRLRFPVRDSRGSATARTPSSTGSSSRPIWPPATASTSGARAPTRPCTRRTSTASTRRPCATSHNAILPMDRWRPPLGQHA